MNVGLTFTIGARDLASKVLKGVGSAIRDTFVFAGGQLLAQGLVKAMNGLRSFVDMAMEAESANTALDASLRGLGIYTPKLAKDFRDLSEAMKDEIGVSDDVTKKLIAQLLTLGVMPDKIGFAVKAINALVAAGKEGEGATKAVTKMLQGDLSGFERLSGAVKNATTDEEKFAQIQKMLSAGYEQQREKLNTVSGAWNALKERISDAIEDIGLAIFQGAELGKTFGDMQSKVAEFLNGEQWKEFLGSIEKGAKFAKELASDLMNQGGFMESMKAISELIASAFVDGAMKAVAKIKDALVENGVAIGKMGIKTANPLGLATEGTKKMISSVFPSIGNFLFGKDEKKTYTETAVRKIQETSQKNRVPTQDELAKEMKQWQDELAGKGKEAVKDQSKAELDINIAKIAQLTRQKKAQEELDAKHKKRIEEEANNKEKLLADEKRMIEKETAERAKLAQERYEMLLSEFVDPSKRKQRIESEKQAIELANSIDKEYADIQRKQSSMFGLRNPSEREKQVIELMDARKEAKSSEQDYAKITAENTGLLAEKIDSLLQIRNQ